MAESGAPEVVHDIAKVSIFICPMISSEHLQTGNKPACACIHRSCGLFSHGAVAKRQVSGTLHSPPAATPVLKTTGVQLVGKAHPKFLSWGAFFHRENGSAVAIPLRSSKERSSGSAITRSVARNRNYPATTPLARTARWTVRESGQVGPRNLPRQLRPRLAAAQWRFPPDSGCVPNGWQLAPAEVGWPCWIAYLRSWCRSPFGCTHAEPNGPLGERRLPLRTSQQWRGPSLGGFDRPDQSDLSDRRACASCGPSYA